MLTNLIIENEYIPFELSEAEAEFVETINRQCPRRPVYYSLPYDTYDTWDNMLLRGRDRRSSFLSSILQMIEPHLFQMRMNATQFQCLHSYFFGDDHTEPQAHDFPAEICGVELQDRRPRDVNTAQLVESELVENAGFELPPDFQNMQVLGWQHLTETLREGELQQLTKDEVPDGYELTGRTLNADEDLDALFEDIDKALENK